jgi:ribosomal-protein-alanine N-acetyltransferase
MAELTTERLLLRALTAEHVAVVTTGRRLYGWAPDFPSAGDREMAGMLERNGLPADSCPVFGQRLVVERDTGLVVGGIGFFGPPEDGRGYATEAATAMVRLSLGLPAVTEVVAMVDPRNAASVRVLEKAGLSFRARDDDGEARYGISSTA